MIPIQTNRHKKEKTNQIQVEICFLKEKKIIICTNEREREKRTISGRLVFPLCISSTFFTFVAVSFI